MLRSISAFKTLKLFKNCKYLYERWTHLKIIEELLERINISFYYDKYKLVGHFKMFKSFYEHLRHLRIIRIIHRKN